ncbi:MAG: flavodoxin family protein [Pseudomonadota bacterium]
MDINVLGICGSPIKGGNTETFLREAMKAIEGMDSVKTEMISVVGKNISDCKHCNWCLRKQEEGKFCAIQDDMVDIFPKVLNSDVLLLASPAYVCRVSGYLATLMDRLRACAFGNVYEGKLKDKVGGAFAVGWMRHGGIETTLLSIDYLFFGFEMIPACVHHPGVIFGAGGTSSFGGRGEFDPKDKLGILKDEYGLNGARALAKRTVELARIIKAGKQALGM